MLFLFPFKTRCQEADYFSASWRIELTKTFGVLDSGQEKILSELARSLSAAN